MNLLRIKGIPLKERIYALRRRMPHPYWPIHMLNQRPACLTLNFIIRSKSRNSLNACTLPTSCLRALIKHEAGSVCTLLALSTHLVGKVPWKNLRSLHSPPFSGRTPLGLRRTRPIQNANFLALELLEFSGDFPVIFRCRSAGLVSPTDFPTDCPSDFHQTSRQIPLEMTGQQRKVRRKSGGLQRTPSRQPSLLVLLMKNINRINKPNNTLNEIVHY